MNAATLRLIQDKAKADHSTNDYFTRSCICRCLDADTKTEIGWRIGMSLGLSVSENECIEYANAYKAQWMEVV